MQDLIPQFLAKSNPSGAEPVPKAALMNETQNLAVPVEPGKTYKFRVINIGAFAGQYLWFEGHTMRIVEVDGVYTKAKEAGMVYIAAAQRVSFLLTTKNDTSANFPIVASMDTVSLSNRSYTSTTLLRQILTNHPRPSLMSSPQSSITMSPAGSPTTRKRTSPQPPPSPSSTRSTT